MGIEYKDRCFHVKGSIRGNYGCQWLNGDAGGISWKSIG